MPLQPGTTLGPYKVTAKIGEGGMGEVYRARDTKLDRDVALKVLPDAFTADPDRLARFEREAKVLASLNHSNIAAIYGVEKAGDTRAVVFELVEGPTLANLIAEGPMPMEQALAIAKGVEDALKAAHDHGIVHGDLTPANVTITKTSQVKVLGFGCGPVASDDPQVDTEAFEAMCERLLGMKTPSERSALPTAIQESGPGRRPVPLTAWRWSWRFAGVVLSLALASSRVGLFWPRVIVPTRVAVSGPVGAQLVTPEVSPDGQTVAFTAFVQRQGQVYVGSLSSQQAVPLLGGEGSWASGGFSPDGQWLLVTDFQPPKMLKKVPAAGGLATPVAEGGNVGATWGPDDTIVVGSHEGLWRVPASGGQKTPLTSLAEGEEGHWLPRFLPSGRAVVFFIQTGDRNTAQVAVYDFNTGMRRTLLVGTDAGYAASGHLLFWRDSALWAVAFDSTHLEISGTPAIVVPEVAADRMGDAMYSVSGAGTLAYIPTRQTSSTPEVILIPNWFEELTRLVPVP